jgi:hypothetical protein
LVIEQITTNRCGILLINIADWRKEWQKFIKSHTIVRRLAWGRR